MAEAQFGYIKPGGTGSQTDTGGGGVTLGSVNIKDLPASINPCGSTADLPPSVGESDCDVSPTPLPDFQSIIKDQDNGTTYITYSIEPTYDTDFHTVQLPVASDVVSNASFAVLANTTEKKKVTWMAQKIGAWPAMPSFFTNDSNAVILRAVILSKNLELMGDQATKIYTVTGEYSYGFFNPASVSMYVGVPPYINDSIGDSVIPNGNFVTGIAAP